MSTTRQLFHGVIAALLYLGVAYIVDFIIATVITDPSTTLFFWSHVAVSFAIAALYFFLVPRSVPGGAFIMAMVAVALDLVFTPSTQLAGRFGAVFIHRILSIAIPAVLGGFLGSAWSRKHKNK